MDYNNLDIIKTIIETPKELTKYAGFSHYEREQMIRNLNMAGEQFAYDKQLIEFQRRENKFMNKYEEDSLYYD